MNAPASCRDCTNPFCRALSQSARERLSRSRIWINFPKKNQQLFFLENKQIVILHEGIVMPSRANVDMRQQSIDLMGPGDLLGIVNLFPRAERDSFSILPLTDSAGCMVPAHAMEALVREDGSVGEAVIRQYSDRYARLVDNYICKTLSSSTDRLRYAIRQMEKYGVHSASHETLALLSGLNRVTVTKTLAKILRETEGE